MDRWTAASAVGGVRLDRGPVTFQVSAGPVVAFVGREGGDDLSGLGMGAEIGLLDVYPVPSVGLGLSIHGATTTSHS